MKRYWAIVVLVAGLGGLVRAEDSVVIRCVSGSSCVFADRAATWRVELSAPVAYEGTVAWNLALGGGVVARREQNISIRPEVPAVLEVQVDLPAVRAGVEVEGRLSVELLDGQRQLRSKFVLPVWTFGLDPAAQQKQRLQELDFRVYDPDGKTLQKLADLGWPCQSMVNLAAFESLGVATVIIGEGCSLGTRGLMASITQAARRGARVVFLSPADGEFTPPDAAELRFHNALFAQALDKRLELLPHTAFRLTGSRAGALVTVDPAGGWCGFEARWANGGRLLLTTYELLDSWDDLPVPRYLLFKMLEYVTSQKEKES